MVSARSVALWERGVLLGQNLLIISSVLFAAYEMLIHRTHHSDGCIVSENKPDQVIFSSCVSYLWQTCVLADIT